MSAIRTYDKRMVVTIGKTTARYGELSNMASHMALYVNEVFIPSSEALYQACKFPLYPDIQAEIINQSNPFRAKLVARKYASYVRQDWDSVKYEVMRWCLRVKYMQHSHIFGGVLEGTADNVIVEYSKRDDVWGAKPIDENRLQGVNALGRLLMELRNDMREGRITKVVPPHVNGFLLFGVPITTVFDDSYYLEDI